MSFLVVLIVAKPWFFGFFGYGSLAWNSGFEYDEKVIGYIKNYKPVFDLACIDHRGTPKHPWGAAYCVRGGPEKEKTIMEYLERRECEYDEKKIMEFFEASTI
ncbi:hypothetical protein AgCh_001434 [Apium graveolens]